jgi:hypothetical protein
MDVILCVCQHCGRFWVQSLPNDGMKPAPELCACGYYCTGWIFVPADKAKANAKAVLEFLEVP